MAAPALVGTLIGKADKELAVSYSRAITFMTAIIATIVSLTLYALQRSLPYMFT
jgi:Na+-driven multidrug efflux pump